MSTDREPQARLVAVPCSVTKARHVVDAWHRHHGSSTPALYAAAVATEDGIVRGVALIGRPVARLLDDGWTLEVTRVATDGTPNACSALYGIARRLGAALGYARLVTYTREDEPGSSPRAAGLTDDGPIRARSWDMPGRRRTDKTEIVRRRRWSLDLAESMDLTWPAPVPPQDSSLFDFAALATPLGEGPEE
jgi:hypothetical protein